MKLRKRIYRRLRHAWKPLLVGFRRRKGQERIQRSVPLRPEDRSDKRRRQHVLVDLVHEELEGGALEIAEIGTRTGRTARHVARYCPQVARLVAIDLEPPLLPDIFADEPRITFRQGWSDEAAKDFADESFDLVFIDADHSEEWVLRDLAAWLPKVRAGGVIAGHDYGAPHHPGVKRAVDRVFANHPHPVRLEANKVWWTRKA